MAHCRFWSPKSKPSLPPLDVSTRHLVIVMIKITDTRIKQRRKTTSKCAELECWLLPAKMVSRTTASGRAVWAGQVVHIFNSSTPEAQVGWPLWSWGQPGLHCEFQTSQRYIAIPCLKKKREMVCVLGGFGETAHHQEWLLPLQNTKVHYQHPHVITYNCL